MIRTKVGLLVLCLMVFGMMAMSATEAQASLYSWEVLSSLKAELLGEKDSEHLTLLTKLLGLKISITCTSVSFLGINAEAEGKLTTGGKGLFTGCEGYENGVLGTKLSCNVHTTGKA